MQIYWDSIAKQIVISFDPAFEIVDVTSIYTSVVPNPKVKKVETSAEVGYPIITHNWRSDQPSTDPAPWPIQNPPLPGLKYFITPKFIDKNGIDKPYPVPDASMPPTQIGPDTIQYRFDFTALATRGGDNGQTSIVIQIEDSGGGGGTSGVRGLADWVRAMIVRELELIFKGDIPEPRPKNITKKAIKRRK